MTAVVADRRLAPARAPRVRPGTPAGRADRSTRPSRPSLTPRTLGGSARGCAVSPPLNRLRVTVVDPPLVVTRLTERGLALVLALVALVTVACVAAVGVTAFQVMAEPVAAAASR